MKIGMLLVFCVGSAVLKVNAYNNARLCAFYFFQPSGVNK
jgi:hypothetical protein